MDSKKINADAIPLVMRKLPQWVVWKLEPRDLFKPEGPSNKKTKVPYIAAAVKAGRLTKAASNNAETWGTFELALEALAADPSITGIGYCFSKEDGLVGIDLDNCFDASGELLPWGREIVDQFDGTYIEYSPSRKGLHILCLGRAVKPGKRVVISTARGVQEAIEIYDYRSSRYFTVTGNSFRRPSC